MTTLLSYALCTVADVKESLGIDAGNTSKDNLITRKINQATDMIERYCGGRRFASTVYTNEEYDATNSDQLSLKQYPIISFTSLSSRDSTLNDSSWSTVDSEYYFTDTNAGVLDLTFNASGRWNRYRVTYTAGYETIPSDLIEACATLASYLVENGAAGTGVKKKQEGQRSIEYFDPNGNSTQGTTSIFDQIGIDEILQTYCKYPISEK